MQCPKRRIAPACTSTLLSRSQKQRIKNANLKRTGIDRAALRPKICGGGLSFLGVKLLELAVFFTNILKIYYSGNLFENFFKTHHEHYSNKVNLKTYREHCSETFYFKCAFFWRVWHNVHASFNRCRALRLCLCALSQIAIRFRSLR